MNERPGHHSATLVLCPAPEQLGGEGPGWDSCSWAAAQQDAQYGFAGYDRFLCLPAQFPAGVFEHAREEMCRRLRSRVQAGAIVLFVVPTSELALDVIDEDWNRMRLVVELVTGTRIERVSGERVPSVVVARDCPSRLASHLARHPPAMLFRLDEEQPPQIAAWGRSRALAGLGSVAFEPCAVAGFPTGGAWAIVAGGGDRPTAGELARLFGLFGDLADLRDQNAADIESEAQATSDALSRLRPLKGDRGPTAPKKVSHGRAAEAPMKSLKGPKLYAVPHDATRGFLQRCASGDGPHKTSVLLHRGPWALATVLLDKRWYGNDAAGRVPIRTLHRALEDADIPAGNSGSLSRYLSELRAALNNVLEEEDQAHFLRLEGRKGVVHLDRLQAVLAPSGAAVRSTRDNSPG